MVSRPLFQSFLFSHTTTNTKSEGTISPWVAACLFSKSIHQKVDPTGLPVHGFIFFFFLWLSGIVIPKILRLGPVTLPFWGTTQRPSTLKEFAQLCGIKWIKNSSIFQKRGLPEANLHSELDVQVRGGIIRIVVSYFALTRSAYIFVFVWFSEAAGIKTSTWNINSNNKLVTWIFRIKNSKNWAKDFNPEIQLSCRKSKLQLVKIVLDGLIDNWFWKWTWQYCSYFAWLIH